MIYVKIGSYFLFASYIWNNWIIYKWSDLSSLKWKDIIVNENLDSTVYPLANTLMINDLVNDQSTCDFTVLDTTNSCEFVKGNPITIWDNNFEIIFSGFIDSVSKKHYGSYPSVQGMENIISCVDNHYVVNKRRLVKAFSDENVSDAVTYILENILEEEGITLGYIGTTTKTITKVYNYVNIKDILDELAEYAGFVWFISAEKKLYFIDITEYNAPFDIILDSENKNEYIKDGSFSVSDVNSEYRNTEYMIGSTNKSTLQTQTFKGDGENQTWSVRLPILEQPTITVNGVSKTIGIIEVNTGYDFYWSKDTNQISQDTEATKLTSSDILTVKFYGSYPIVVKSFNYAEILNRATIEGTSGKVEDVVNDMNYKSKDDALDRLNILLDTYGINAKTIIYTTRIAGIEAGQIQNIQSTFYNINDSCLITQVAKQETEYEIEYIITAVKGPVQDFWIKKMMKMSEAKAKKLAETVAESSVLLILFEFDKTWTDIENPNIFQEVYPSESIFADNAFIPCFETTNKCEYLQINISGGYRLQKTDQTVIDNQVITTFIVPSQDCNGSFTQIKFFGGDLADETIDSGELLSTHSFIYTKNSLESFQIVVTYNKWS